MFFLDPLDLFSKNVPLRFCDPINRNYENMVMFFVYQKFDFEMHN